jgi:hypothetical protein
VHTTVSDHGVGHQMLVYKLQGELVVPFFVSIKQFLQTGLRTKRLYTSFRAMLVHRSLRPELVYKRLGRYVTLIVVDVLKSK